LGKGRGRRRQEERVNEKEQKQLGGRRTDCSTRKGRKWKRAGIGIRK
jgi:hypothetical protein